MVVLGGGRFLMSEVPLYMLCYPCACTVSTIECAPRRCELHIIQRLPIERENHFIETSMKTPLT